MKILLSKDEAKALESLAGNFVKNPQLLVQDLTLEVSPEDSVEFINAIAPLLTNIDAMDNLINSNAVKKGIHMVTGLPIEFGTISCRDTITNFFIRAYEYKRKQLLKVV